MFGWYYIWIITYNKDKYCRILLIYINKTLTDARSDYFPAKGSHLALPHLDQNCPSDVRYPESMCLHILQLKQLYQKSSRQPVDKNVFQIKCSHFWISTSFYEQIHQIVQYWLALDTFEIWVKHWRKECSWRIID